MENVKEDKMKRGEFLRSLGLSTSTLMAFYCLGTTMTACGSSDDDPEPNPGGGGGTGVTGTTTGSAINFTIDLTNDATKKLKTAGQYDIYGDVLVAFTSTNQYVALSKICTHEGNPVRYQSGPNNIQCPTHQSEFALTGAVTQGPATNALKAYKTALSTDGNTLTVTA
ncbi:QcrA and Rieske domain-containing protein [Dyadobacter fanqingshengii]|uniref:Rieske 2Fe-2S domain-containing protein n=1 Tax=Dyadobacter fanqingshengii TaxID=2906443 RepID=A0A9X1TEK1_9BACT|nr:Rieske 2Fe-2S domain-containing protein [Dyadobacter fanqingshengii]MCF0038617.1 Rieske 2Fe-2S domain-containing protein [Dyadobacter fanqingshengii]MCF2503853.1 Rieske 2Fe-2S domain-containing protein [Dyadobacter fanqingshengii]USJ34550.1 Rieske 2Fe-2S domain-containing protein [Dyadobacter fanqingshengii]